MRILRQIIFDLRTQPVIGTISVIGTALAILLVMMATIVYEIDYAPIAPESNRDRLLYDGGLFLRKDNRSSCSGLSLLAIDKLYRPMKTPEHIAAVSKFFEPVDVEAEGVAPVIADHRKADAEMWHIFDHTFLSGAPFSREDVEAGRDVAVIDESTARRLFGTTDAAGRIFRVKGKSCMVRGVIRDVSPLMKWSYAQVWLPAVKTASLPDEDHSELCGDFGVVLMAPDAASLPAVRAEARALNDSFNRELMTTGFSRVDCEAPYTQLELSQVHGSNNPPDMANYYMLRYILLGIFLLVPAMNLSGMTKARLERRSHETGIRRAFGATRRGILFSILRENFVVTLIGGTLGLILSIICVTLLADILFEIDSWDGVSAPLKVTWEMLFRWSTFGWALLFCLILNLLSAGPPAYKASRIPPVDAINQSES